MLLDFWYKV